MVKLLKKVTLGSISEKAPKANITVSAEIDGKEKKYGEIGI